ncbi:hypothetical protein MCHI_003463 [Candidatus Magnetoovum chiemensis]|nr:hypothetical protein MCHI_003463 [Candidatus Magnetoovum chiemensis]
MIKFMRNITSPNTFKTCYIAQVKEEIGLPVKRASNRKGLSRKIVVPDDLRTYIKQAIENLKNNRQAIYKNIQYRSIQTLLL